MFEREAAALRQLMDSGIAAIHPIGSTSIPEIPAKPIIDLLVEVSVIMAVDRYNPLFVDSGYLPMGEYYIPGRRYVIHSRLEDRTANIHMFQTGSPHLQRHLDFRDYMAAHPAEAQVYGDLKVGLAQRFPEDLEAYMDGKDAYIKGIEIKAAAWRANKPL
jgi:GrpB-like predicted nucleotidyltransferase (UPF0157 family)